MPIVYIHGVANRDQTDWQPIGGFLRRYVAEVLNPANPVQVAIIPVFWGDVGVQFAWNGQSRPRTQLTGQGTGSAFSALTPEKRAQLLADPAMSLPELSASPISQPSSRLTSGAVTTNMAGPSLRLKELSRQQLSDLLATVAYQPGAGPQQQSWAAIAADDVAHYDGATPYAEKVHTDIFAQLTGCSDTAAEIELVDRLLFERYRQLESEQSPLAGQGVDWLDSIKDRLTEVLNRANQSEGYFLSQWIGEARPRLNEFLTLFIGDVFTYLDKRGSATEPGPIVQRLLDGIGLAKQAQQQANGEPIVVLSHSMGGQVVYDALTYFLPNMPAYQATKVDFWCATASQVGLFEEMKLLKVSDRQYSQRMGLKAPFPNRNHLGYWWNVWDANDFLSYTAATIFDGVDDEPYDSGMSLLGAHSGYLKRPSFYRKLAEKLRSVL